MIVFSGVFLFLFYCMWSCKVVSTIREINYIFFKTSSINGFFGPARQGTIVHWLLTTKRYQRCEYFWQSDNLFNEKGKKYKTVKMTQNCVILGLPQVFMEWKISQSHQQLLSHYLRKIQYKRLPLMSTQVVIATKTAKKNQ